jgi:hypothetical protein
MDVIGHDDVSANGNIEVALGSLSKVNEGGMNLVTRKASDSIVRGKRDEVERARVKNSGESKRSPRVIFLHA